MAYFLVTANTDLTALGKPRRLTSWHFAETAGTNPVQVRLRNGSVTGDIVAEIRLATGTSASQSYGGQPGLHFPQGLFVEKAGTGTLSGSVDLN